jgi:hypothetical protein
MGGLTHTLVVDVLEMVFTRNIDKIKYSCHDICSHSFPTYDKIIKSQ